MVPRLDIAKHDFTQTIAEILEGHFGEESTEVFSSSPILVYLNTKTKAANRGSKSRASFTNLYALYVVVEDYIRSGFFDGTAKIPYSAYEGARYMDLFKRQRQLPFGSKMQNHSLNHRVNTEFHKYNPAVNKPVIVRNVEEKRYWIQEDLILVTIRNRQGQDQTFNIAQAIIDIIDRYVQARKAAFDRFLETCQHLSRLGNDDPEQAVNFVMGQLTPNADAHVFEIVSYAVLKAKYRQETIWIGDSKEDVTEEFLALYKTGRTNANDGGIDFVMKPVGRFFQVTETVDASKYFLDIDKIQKFPITFVVKSSKSAEQIRADIRSQAIRKYKIESVVNAYMDAVEEVINVVDLVNAFNDILQSGELESVMDEIILQSKVEFNYQG